MRERSDHCFVRERRVGSPSPRKKEFAMDQVASEASLCALLVGIAAGAARAEPGLVLAVRIERATVTVRPHHAHRYRAGVLEATLTIVRESDGAVQFARRAAAHHTESAEYGTDAQLMSRLATTVAADWITAFEEQGIAGTRTGKG